MPVIDVSLIPDGLRDRPCLANLVSKSIPETVAAIPELELTPEAVTVRVPNDLVGRLGEELIVEVNYLFNMPGRTDDVLQRLADDLAMAVSVFVAKANLVRCQKIEVFVRVFGTTRVAFAAWHRQSKQLPHLDPAVLAMAHDGS